METIQSDSEATEHNLKNGGTAVGASSLPSEQFGPGDYIDERYQIISVLGRGGCGCVYKVIQIALKKQFALKTLNPINTSEITTLRLHKEAQAASRLQHPNLVRAVDFGMIGGTQPYLVMDLVEGPTLSQYLKQHGKASVKDALHMFLPLCSALAYAHEQGVVHRDLKPSNVILSGDDSQYIPKIVDFGIAKLKSSDATHAMTLTATGDIFGTPLYMSPEQCMGTGVDGRSDIYALGCMLFETVTGAPPFSGTNPLEIMMQHNTAKMPSLKEASLGETFPPALERVIGRMLEKDPKDRYQDCKAVAMDLEAINRGDFKGISVAPDAVALRQKQQMQLSASLVSAAIGIIIGAVMGFAAQQYMSPPAEPQSKFVPDEGTGLFGLATKFSYFSNTTPDSKIFDFTSSNQKLSLGKISWWEAGKLKSVQAIGKQTIPRNAKVTFAVEGVMMAAPDLWARFRPRDFQGILVAPHTCFVELDPLNQSIRAIAGQDDLRILTLNEKLISSKSFHSLGQLSRLRWLGVNHILLDNIQSYLTGAKLAKLENFNQLTVLHMEKVQAVTPALKELANGSPMRRLGILSTTLNAEDIQYLTKLHSLEVLNLHDNTVAENVDVLNQVAKLPKLQQLLLDGKLLEHAKVEDVSKLKNLTLVTDGDTLPPPIRTAISNNRSIKLIEDSALVKSGGELFDPLKADPDAVLSPS
ncbi:MAG: serine/threonine protein kinase [Candidatus Melainabacteria bacterium]|nr:serine/threonine protein kinase [Candidatus Melainabacteria bacterium]